MVGVTHANVAILDQRKAACVADLSRLKRVVLETQKKTRVWRHQMDQSYSVLDSTTKELKRVQGSLDVLMARAVQGARDRNMDEVAANKTKRGGRKTEDFGVDADWKRLQKSKTTTEDFGVDADWKRLQKSKTTTEDFGVNADWKRLQESKTEAYGVDADYMRSLEDQTNVCAADIVKTETAIHAAQKDVGRFRQQVRTNNIKIKRNEDDMYRIQRDIVTLTNSVARDVRKNNDDNARRRIVGNLKEKRGGGGGSRPEVRDAKAIHPDRRYTVTRTSVGAPGGRYTSKSGPADAARKAATKRFGETKARSDISELTLTVRQIGAVGASVREYTYDAKRTKLDRTKLDRTKLDRTKLERTQV
jgi:hypothetical protein